MVEVWVKRLGMYISICTLHTETTSTRSFVDFVQLSSDYMLNFKSTGLHSIGTCIIVLQRYFNPLSFAIYIFTVFKTNTS